MGIEKINVCYAISDKSGNYTKIAGTSIRSVLQNTSEDIAIHILHDGTLNQRNLDYLSRLIEVDYGQELHFHDVSVDYASVWNKINEAIPDLENSRLNIATFFRLVMGEALADISRIIYLDGDTIVNLDICELWKEKTGKNGIGAVPDPFIQYNHHNITRMGLVPQKEYFNAGVLLVDLDKFRTLDNLMDKALFFIKKHHPDYLDQDVLNYYFPRSCTLDWKYNVCVWMEQEAHKPVESCIYHYVNNCLGLDMQDDYNALFFRYFSKTPWCDEVFIGKISRMIEYVRFEMLDFAAKCANRRRIVVALENAKDNICQTIGLRNDEVFVPYELLDEYNFDFRKEKDVLLIAVKIDEYFLIRQRLMSFGLTEGVHFFNILEKLGIENSELKEYKLFLQC